MVIAKNLIMTILLTNYRLVCIGEVNVSTSLLY